MTLTPIAQAMTPQVAQVSASVGALFEGNRPFDPTQSNRTIRIATRDICVPLLTPLIAEVSRAGPGLSVEIKESSRIQASVVASEAHIGPGFGPIKQSATLAVRLVRNLTWCVFAPLGHRYIAAPNAERWAAAAHVLVGARNHQTGPVEAKAKAMGLERHVSCYAPNFTAALGLAAKCGALFTSLKEPFCLNGPPPGMVVCPMPFTADFAMPYAPAILTLRKAGGDPFETWLSGICQSFEIAGDHHPRIPPSESTVPRIDQTGRLGIGSASCRNISDDGSPGQ